MVSYQCVPVCVVFARFQCVCIYSRRWFVPTLHSQNHGCATLYLFRNQSHLFLFTLYMPVFVFVSNLFVCVNCILSSCVFLPTLCLSATLCLPAVCLSANGVSVKSDLFVSTLLVLFVPTLGVCVYSRRCLRPLCFCPLCVLLVFLFILFHTKTYELSVISGTWVML